MSHTHTLYLNLSIQVGPDNIIKCLKLNEKKILQVIINEMWDDIFL